jgi:pyruvate formate lyase activating enzyme
MVEFPLIVEIKGNSLDDGPGIRSVIFFKGCPLSCTWCHNPECISPDPALKFDPGSCIHCDSCITGCTAGALSRDNQFFVDRGACNHCFSCTKLCPAAALTPLGQQMEPTEIVEQVIRDKPFFNNSGGGVTLSGGEPTLHLAFTGELLAALKRAELRTLLETCGLFDLARFRQLALPFIDIIYMDLKLLDDRLHRHYCGAGNSVILENLARLHELSRDSEFTIVPRIPLVPGITDTPENLTAAACFLREHGFSEVKLLPYNPLWVDKLFSIGLPNPYSRDHPMMNWQPREELARCEQLIRSHGLNVPDPMVPDL